MANETYYVQEEKSAELTAVLKKQPVWWLRWGTIALFIFLLLVIVCFCQISVNSRVVIPVQSFVVKNSTIDLTVPHPHKNYFSFYPDQKATVNNSCSGLSVTGNILSVGQSTGMNRPDTIHLSVTSKEPALAGWRPGGQYTISLWGKVKLYRKFLTN